MMPCREIRESWHVVIDRIGAPSSARHLPPPGIIVREAYG